MEVIVVDDASMDDTLATATQMSVHVLRLAEHSEPATALNHGARHRRGKSRFFVYADVVAAPETVHPTVELFAEHVDVAVTFGPYDARPRAKGIVSHWR